jgi:hypothetical protein
VVDTSTNQSTMEIQAGDDYVLGIADQFLKIPKSITQDPELDIGPRYLYAVLLDYVHLSMSYGNGKAAFPSRETLAEKCAVADDTIGRWLKKLNERGWISWQRRPNQSSLYFVWGPDPMDPSRGNWKPQNPETGNSVTGNRKIRVPETAKSVPIQNHSTQNNSNQNHTNAHARAREESGGGGNEVQRKDQTSLAQLNRGDNVTPAPGRVSTEPKTWREQENPWWDVNKRRDKLAFLTKPYPKMTPIIEAMVTFRMTVGEDIDDADKMNRIWHGLQWWIQKWQREGTEERYIPSFARWVERRQWEQADVNPAVMVRTGSGS